MMNSLYILFVGFAGTTGIAYWVLRNPAKNWVVILGKLTKFKEIVRKDVIFPNYPVIEFCSPEVEYKYSYNGKDYKSSRVAIHYRDIAERKALENPPWENWVKGKSIKVFVNPKVPSESILIVGIAQERKFIYMRRITSMYFTVIACFIGVEYFL